MRPLMKPPGVLSGLISLSPFLVPMGELPWQDMFLSCGQGMVHRVMEQYEDNKAK